MGLITGLAVFFIVWWLVLFMVLPWGIQPVAGEDVAKGHAPSAPRRPRILYKMAVTTVITAIVFTVIYGIAESDLISFRE